MVVREAEHPGGPGHGQQPPSHLGRLQARGVGVGGLCGERGEANPHSREG